MDVQEVKLKNALQMQPIKSKEIKDRKTPPFMPAPNYIGSFIAASGCGKTTAFLNMARELHKCGTYQKFIVFSPSCNSDLKFDNCGIDWDDKIDLYSQSKLEDIMQEHEQDIKDYDEYVKDIELYNKFMKGVPLEKFTKDDKIRLFGMMLGNELVKPESKYDKSPHMLLIFDDLGSSDCYSNKTSKNYMNNLNIRCRHKQVTIWHAVQALSQLPRTIRQNCRLVCLWRTKDTSILSQLAKENAGHAVSEEEFLKLFDAATSKNKHDFLMCDFQNTDELLMFRRNFDNVLTIQ